MATEYLRAPASRRGTPTTDWPDPAATSPSGAPEVAPTPVNEDLAEIARKLAPGKALDLGCGEGANSIWLATQGWTVRSVDMSASAISEASAAASGAGVTVLFDVADISEWRPASRYDLVICTFALPARGMGRSRMLEMAAAAVAPGGSLLVTEFDISLARQGWMAEKYLVSIEELERHLYGFRIDHSGVRMARHRHGYEERVLPAARVIATRSSVASTRY
jgi:trans-aconitate methyltransferase